MAMRKKELNISNTERKKRSNKKRLERDDKKKTSRISTALKNTIFISVFEITSQRHPRQAMA